MMTLMSETPFELPGPEYRNSPLSGVVFEVRFAGEPAIECHRDVFFEMARSEFPRVLVPKVNPGEAIALSPYHFQRADGAASLLTALNLFAYNTTAYPGYAQFRPAALKWTKAFAKQFKIGAINRTGLRYTNIIPYAPNEPFPVSNFLDVETRLGVVKSSSFRRFSFAALIPSQGISSEKNGTLTVQIDQVEDESKQPAILLDFDFSMAGELHIDEVDMYLDTSHDETKRLFEGLITQKYRSFLRGEELE
jgi:uncharacterized protein (TIGR04255 family)